MKGVFWCPVDPATFTFRLFTRNLAFSFEILAMAQNQVVDAPTKDGEQFVLRNVHRAKDGAVATRRTNLVANSNTDREVPHPI